MSAKQTILGCLQVWEFSCKKT